MRVDLKVSILLFGLIKKKRLKCRRRRVDQVLQIILLALSYSWSGWTTWTNRRWQGQWIHKGHAIYHVVLKRDGNHRLLFPFCDCDHLSIWFFSSFIDIFDCISLFAVPQSTSASMTSMNTHRNLISRRMLSMWTKVGQPTRSSKWKPTMPIVRPSMAIFVVTTFLTKINHSPLTMKVCTSFYFLLFNKNSGLKHMLTLLPALRTPFK